MCSDCSINILYTMQVLAYDLGIPRRESRVPVSNI